MRLLERILLLLWDPTGSRRRAQDVRVRQTVEVVRSARRVRRNADRIVRLRADSLRAESRLGR